MTPNKLPPLPKHAHAFQDPEGDQPDILVYTADQMQAYADEAIRQSQSLPAGAVSDAMIEAARSAYSVDRISNGEIMDKIAGPGFGDRLIRGLIESALQADAREKGEDPVAWRIVGGSGELACFETESDKAAAWNGYYAAIPMYDHPATQPAQASEAVTERGVSLAWRPLLQWAIGTIDELNGGPMTVAEWDEDAGLYQLARNLAFNDAIATSSQETASE